MFLNLKKMKWNSVNLTFFLKSWWWTLHFHWMIRLLHSITDCILYRLNYIQKVHRPYKHIKQIESSHSVSIHFRFALLQWWNAEGKQINFAIHTNLKDPCMQALLQSWILLGSLPINQTFVNYKQGVTISALMRVTATWEHQQPDDGKSFEWEIAGVKNWQMI